MEELFKSKDKKSIENWIDDQVNIDTRDQHDFSPLMWACRFGYDDMVAIIISKNANLNLQNSVGDTALSIACQEGHEKIVKMLVQNKAELNLANDHGNTPLHFACFWRRKELAMFLISEGAEIVLNNADKSPLDFSGNELKNDIKDILKRAIMKEKPQKAEVRKQNLVELSLKNQFLSKHRKNFFGIDHDSINRGATISLTSKFELYEGSIKGLPVIIKQLRRKKLDYSDLEKLRRGAEKLQKYSHPSLLAVIGGCFSSNKPCVIYENVPVSKLSDEIFDADVHLLPPDIFKWVAEFAEALNVLHSHGISHGNIRSSNVWINKQKNLVLTDYGFYGTPMAQYDETSMKMFETEWIAPEMLRKSATSSPLATDIYSFGILLYQMVTRKRPYDGMNSMQIGLKVVTECMRPEIPDNVPEKISSLIQSCWDENPGSRPTITEVIGHLQAFHR